MIPWYCIPGHPLLNQNPGCHGIITAETTQLLAHPTLEGVPWLWQPCACSAPAHRHPDRAEAQSVSHLRPRDWDEHCGPLRCVQTWGHVLLMALVRVGQPAQGAGAHLSHTNHSWAFKGTAGHTGMPWTVHGDPISHWWRVNHHVREQSQGLDLDGIPWQDTYRFFLSVVFASRPSRTIVSWEHQVHCKVFLEVFTCTVAGFTDSDSILQLPASLTPSQHHWQAGASAILPSLFWGRLQDPRRLNTGRQWSRYLLISGSKSDSGFACFVFSPCT